MLYYLNHEFEWDDAKATENYRKHNISFSEAASTWNDYRNLETIDPDNSTDNETRWIRMALDSEGRLLVIIYCIREGGRRLRIISARKATSVEQQIYTKG